MIIADISNLHNGSIVKVKDLIFKCIKSGYNYVKISQYKLNNMTYSNNSIETIHGNITVDEYLDKLKFKDEEINYLSNITKDKIKIYSVVCDKKSIDLMSKYTEICEIEYSTSNSLIINYANTKFKKVIISIIEPTVSDIIDLYYKYPFIIIMINTQNLSVIKDLKIGNIDIGYYNNTEALHIVSYVYGARFFEKNFINENINNKLINNIKLLKKNKI